MYYSMGEWEGGWVGMRVFFTKISFRLLKSFTPRRNCTQKKQGWDTNNNTNK